MAHADFEESAVAKEAAGRRRRRKRRRRSKALPRFEEQRRNAFSDLRRLEATGGTHRLRLVERCSFVHLLFRFLLSSSCVFPLSPRLRSARQPKTRPHCYPLSPFRNILLPGRRPVTRLLARPPLRPRPFLHPVRSCCSY